MKKKVLFISNLFPNPKEPHMAAFNRQQVEALSKLYNIDVVAPIAWTNRIKLKNFSKNGKVDEIRAFHPTYWHTPGFSRSCYGRLFHHSIKKIVNALHRANRYDLIYSSWLYPDGWAAGVIAESLNLPFFVKVHGSDVNGLVPGSRVTELSLQAARRARKVFCVSGALQEKLHKLGVSPEKTEVVYNGFEASIFKPMEHHAARGSLGIDRSGPCILYVGNLKQAKGLSELALAFSELCRRKDHTDLWMAVVGEGEYDRQLRSMLQQNGVVHRVVFVGSQPRNKVSLWMNAADLLCLPSYMEGVPNVVLESLACGTVVVASAVGGVPELERESEGLYLVHPQDADSLVEGLQIALQHNGPVRPPKFIGSWEQNATQIARHLDPV